MEAPAGRSGTAEGAGRAAEQWSTVTVTDGIRFAVATAAEAEDDISRSLAGGVYPASYGALVRLLRRIVPPGGRVLDLGGHVGSVALAAAAAGYQVVTAEASPRNAALLRASAARNGFERLRVVHAGVSDRPGTLQFCPFGPYGHVFSPVTNFATVPVRALTVDDLLAEVGWDRVDFIKMDIEGSEVAAVRGMARLLAGADAPPIFYESNGHTLNFYGRTPADLKGALERFGYRNYLVEGDRLVPVQAGEVQPTINVDYLALRRLPAGLRDWRIDRPLTVEEVIARLLPSCSAPEVVIRLHAARTLARAPRTIRGDARVAAAIAALRRDPDPEVRRVASPWPGALRDRVGRLLGRPPR